MKQYEHLNPRILDRLLDGDLSPTARRTVESHLAVCRSCARERRRYDILRRDLALLPLPEPPVWLDARILAAVLPAPSERTMWLRLAARAYGVASAALAASGAVALVALGPERLLRLLYSGLSRGILGVFDVLKSLIAGTVSLVKTLGEVLPVTRAFDGAVDGLETAFLALSPQFVLVMLLTMALATLVLVWAVSQPRERGVPHACLSL